VLTVTTHGERDTIALGARLATALRAGDILLLSGPVGAGKSVLARALIQQAQRNAGRAPEDVPSPSFTLAQIYDLGGTEIWHCDLYRLSDPGEVLELGLAEVLDGGSTQPAIAVIEWPDLIREDLGSRYIDIRIEPDTANPDRRTLRVDVQGPGWTAVRAAVSSPQDILHADP